MKPTGWVICQAHQRQVFRIFPAVVVGRIVRRLAPVIERRALDLLGQHGHAVGKALLLLFYPGRMGDHQRRRHAVAAMIVGPDGRQRCHHLGIGGLGIEPEPRADDDALVEMPGIGHRPGDRIERRHRVVQVVFDVPVDAVPGDSEDVVGGVALLLQRQIIGRLLGAPQHEGR
ncbi:hypothetical protein [Kumtagia ephedrae]|uniref:hypothetical protein n=1 Tax=Kumtagia ephedrae TaxID=2116701 RepID=UPI00140410FE|nr:hypothetical protein [Mesorhizobium ephedrae]